MRTPEVKYVCASCGEPKVKRAYDELAKVCNVCKDKARKRRNRSIQRQQQRRAKRDKATAKYLEQGKPQSVLLPSVKRSSARWKAQVNKLVAERKEAPCHDCGDVHPAWLLDFWHVRGEQLLSIPQILRTTVWWKERFELLASELDKCIVVCLLCRKTRIRRLKLSAKCKRNLHVRAKLQQMDIADEPETSSPPAAPTIMQVLSPVALSLQPVPMQQQSVLTDYRAPVLPRPFALPKPQGQ